MDELHEQIIAWQNSAEPDTIDEAEQKISEAFVLLSLCLKILNKINELTENKND